jgi:hypothetical protein
VLGFGVLAGGASRTLFVPPSFGFARPFALCSLWNSEFEHAHGIARPPLKQWRFELLKFGVCVRVLVSITSSHAPPLIWFIANY